MIRTVVLATFMMVGLAVASPAMAGPDAGASSDPDRLDVRLDPGTVLRAIDEASGQLILQRYDNESAAITLLRKPLGDPPVPPQVITTFTFPEVLGKGTDARSMAFVCVVPLDSGLLVLHGTRTRTTRVARASAVRIDRKTWEVTAATQLHEAVAMLPPMFQACASGGDSAFATLRIDGDRAVYRITAPAGSSTVAFERIPIPESPPPRLATLPDHDLPAFMYLPQLCTRRPWITQEGDQVLGLSDPYRYYVLRLTPDGSGRMSARLQTAGETPEVGNHSGFLDGPRFMFLARGDYGPWLDEIQLDVPGEPRYRSYRLTNNRATYVPSVGGVLPDGRVFAGRRGEDHFDIVELTPERPPALPADLPLVVGNGRGKAGGEERTLFPNVAPTADVARTPPLGQTQSGELVWLMREEGAVVLRTHVKDVARFRKAHAE